MDIIAEVCPDLFIDELENLPFGDAGPDASESGYLEHIERKKLDRMYIFDLNLMASPTYPNVQSVKKVEGLCLELYQRNPDDFYAKLFVQRLSRFGGEYTLASDVFGVVEDAALGRRAILDQGQMACREEAAASHGLRAPRCGRLCRSKTLLYKNASASGSSGASSAAALGVSPNDPIK